MSITVFTLTFSNQINRYTNRQIDRKIDNICLREREIESLTD